MPITVLLTGFGSFPGAPFNPTGALVKILALHRGPGVRRVAHVFETRYDAVDRELPALLARESPDVMIMFGLAQRTIHLRIEACARNVFARNKPDAVGRLPAADMIAPQGPPILAMRTPAARLAAAVRAAGLTATVSHDAGGYLCNYLCWRASEAAVAAGGPRIAAFVHVPDVRPVARISSRPGARPPTTLADLVLAGEAILRAAVGLR